MDGDRVPARLQPTRVSVPDGAATWWRGPHYYPGRKFVLTPLYLARYKTSRLALPFTAPTMTRALLAPFADPE